MPADGAIQIAFDRYLLPATVNRQSMGIVDGARMALAPELAPVVVYDPIASSGASAIRAPSTMPIDCRFTVAGSR